MRRSRRRTVAGAGRSCHSWEPDRAGAFEGYAGGLVVFRGYADEIWKDGTPLCAGTAGIT